LTRKALSAARDALRYALARAVASLLQALPWETGRELMGVLGDLAYVLDRASRKRNAAANVMRAFPSLDEKAARRLLRACYRHFCQSILDTLNFTRFAGHWPNEHLFEAEGFDRLDGLDGRTGVLFVTGHFGHWELLGTASRLLGCPVWSVMRRRRNVFVDRYIERMRRRTGQRLLDRHGALRKIIRLIRGGEHVAFLMDQDARRHGIFVDFFGRPARTVDSPARIALRTGAPLAFVYARRIGPRRFRCVLSDVIVPRLDADRDAEVRRITQRLTADLEDVVRQAPHEWLWLHRRWKTYPGKYDGV